MFTHQLPNSDQLFNVQYTEYAETHYLKRFQKNYPGRQWELTDVSIKLDLSRLRLKNNETQRSAQIDELKNNGNHWLAKYDFKIAGTKVSTKDSGNRCVVYINHDKDLLDILLIYHKDDLPKNKKETDFIMDIIKEQYSHILKCFI